MSFDRWEETLLGCLFLNLTRTLYSVRLQLIDDLNQLEGIEQMLSNSLLQGLQTTHCRYVYRKDPN